MILYPEPIVSPDWWKAEMDLGSYKTCYCIIYEGNWE